MSKEKGGKAQQQPKQQQQPDEKQIDESVEGTFPASDPPAVGGTTKINPDEGEGGASEDGGGSDDTKATGVGSGTKTKGGEGGPKGAQGASGSAVGQKTHGN